MSEPIRTPIDAPGAPAAVGPYSHAVRAGDLLFCSGQISLDPQSGELILGSAGIQAEQCLKNLEAVCAAAGTELARAVKVTVYLTDMADFAEVNEVYARFFPGAPPARVAIEVAGLPKGADVEVDAVVLISG
ncbi:MAG: RidA family protein [Solirubrobacteraceae bacterium]|nr:RidA family protein [Solirubrobacteraceae bacterium]